MCDGMHVQCLETALNDVDQCLGGEVPLRSTLRLVSGNITENSRLDPIGADLIRLDEFDQPASSRGPFRVSKMSLEVLAYTSGLLSTLVGSRPAELPAELLAMVLPGTVATPRVVSRPPDTASAHAGGIVLGDTIEAGFVDVAVEEGLAMSIRARSKN